MGFGEGDIADIGRWILGGLGRGILGEEDIGEGEMGRGHWVRGD